ncbi:MAG: class I SAM-dependent methyltransferase [Candidatus Rokuibacteriota bacterium]
MRRYAKRQAADVAPFLVGRRILDLGAGEGYVADALRADDLFVCGVDVGLFQRASVPCVTYDGSRLPFADDTFDTTLILLTLHHCARAEVVLDEARRVTRRRLIVTESVYRNRRDRFWLDLLDARINRFRHGGGMNTPGAFRTREAWRRLFESRGLKTIETRWLGSWWEHLVHHPVLFVLDVQGVSPSKPGMVSL